MGLSYDLIDHTAVTHPYNSRVCVLHTKAVIREKTLSQQLDPAGLKPCRDASMACNGEQSPTPLLPPLPVGTNKSDAIQYYRVYVDTEAVACKKIPSPQPELSSLKPCSRPTVRESAS